VDPVPHPQGLDQLITGFTQRVPGVRHALVVSPDGVPVAASDRIQPDHREMLAAITAGFISLAAGAGRILDLGAVTQGLVAMARGTLVIMSISDGLSLAVLATAEADLDLVAYEMTMLLEQSGGLFTRPAREPVRDADGTA
jgi:predicted regulator of Ras-like GTPase activity (Roadblock/LC7/MglB family)